jgi:hypothetical protein
MILKFWYFGAQTHGTFLFSLCLTVQQVSSQSKYFCLSGTINRGATLSLCTVRFSVGSFLAFWCRCWTMNNVEGSMEKRYNGLGMTKPRHWPPKSGGGGNPAAARRWRWMGVEHRVRWVASEYKRKWSNHRSNDICVTFWKYWIRNPRI